MNGFRFKNGPISVFSNQNPGKGFKFGGNSVDLSSPPTKQESRCDSGQSSSDTNSNGEPTENAKFSNPILRYISDILMDEEDDLERKPCMLQDCLALQAAEKSFYDVLGSDYPSSTREITASFLRESIDSQDPDDNFRRTTSAESNCSYASTDNSSESDWLNGGDIESSFLQTPIVTSAEYAYRVSDASPDPFRDRQASLLHNGTWDIIQSANNPMMMDNSAPKKSKEKRSHRVDDTVDEDEGRGGKISALYSDDLESSEIFDEVLLCHGVERSQSMSCAVPSAVGESSQNGNFQLSLDLAGSNSNGKATRSKKGTNKGTTVDLWTLLTQCAQAVSNYDQRSGNELLKQIRQHSSPFGDGIQRLAHYFAVGLETRLAAGTPSYLHFDSNGATAADMLKAYRLYITASPFQRMSNFLANRTILKLVEKETRLHIIDFGICYGFQWPCLIQRLSERPGGPPMLRITGIDLPQSGFRPAERLEETGRRLENYCKRFNVPFEYNCIAQKWETVQLEDLKIERDEITVVNCLYRLKNLPDETVSVNCPRGAVLKLIRKINPNMFIHGVVNGTYNAPFFLTRFREALFHFSALFDMFEANVPREDAQRLIFEKGIFGRDAINVIACEGAERVERPETYKQWQVRNRRAGFKQLRPDPELLNRTKEMVKMEYHKDFVVDEDGKWVLQGWKGRIIHALSYWKPA
ncbi:hypothetical protein L6164_019221 [Bauhinia variegata]|nr:hypothetical protein L6164_019221 [Bauhinia variegata]